MSADSMTPRERWLAVLTRQTPDRVPMDYWATPETTLKLMHHLGCSSPVEMLRKLHVDFVVEVSPSYVGPTLPSDQDIFGRKTTPMSYGVGYYDEVILHPLAKYQCVQEIQENYNWPNPDWWDYSSIPSQLQGYEDHPVRGGGSEPFLIYKDLRGGEQAAIDLIENPEIVHHCLDHLFELAYQNTLRIFEAIPGRVDYSYVAEDLGGQQDLMYSPAHIREFLFPGMKRMADLIHHAGARVFHHDDGNVTRILPDLLNLGIDILNPIQWRAAGMDRQWLKRQYGNRLIFHGGMDNQFTLPFGSVEEVQQEVRDNLEILGAGGGYILAPCHNIQAITPVENILAMYETGYEEGKQIPSTING